MAAGHPNRALEYVLSASASSPGGLATRKQVLDVDHVCICVFSVVLALTQAATPPSSVAVKVVGPKSRGIESNIAPMSANIRDADAGRNIGGKMATIVTLIMVARPLDEYYCKQFRWKTEYR